MNKRSLRSSSAPLQCIADEKIMEEMKTGGFAKIRGKGAPIRNEPATHVLDNLDKKLNKVLISAGCAPDWIALDKDIRDDIRKLKADIRDVWLSYKTKKSAEEQWQRDREHFRERTERINAKIRKLNFDVPSLHMQRALIRFDSFVDKVASNVSTTAPAELKGDGELVTLSQRNSTPIITQTVITWVCSVIQRLFIGGK